jgi:uncharacterized protein YdaU (DUF1376 family)
MTEKKTSPCFPLYPSDFFGDPKVRLMSGEEQAFYVILLMNMWQNAKDKEMPYLPNDDKKIAQLLRIDVRTWRKIRLAVFDCLKVTAEKIESPRLSREKLKQDNYRESQSEKGKKGGRPSKPEESRSFSPVKPEESHGIISVKPPNPNPNPNPKKAISDSPVDNSQKEEQPSPEKDLLFLEIKNLYFKIQELYPAFKIQKFFQTYKNKNPKAISHTFNRLIEQTEKIGKVESPWAYCEKIITLENLNYNERDHEEQSAEFKKPIDLINWAQNFKTITA